MSERLHDILTAQFEHYRVVDRLHAVPPHEVHEVSVKGRRAVLKYDTGPTGNAGTEGRVVAFVDNATSVPVPTVLATGADWFLAEWCPDAPNPGEAGTPTDEWASVAGRGLATLHQETAPLLDAYGRFCVPGTDGTVVDTESGLTVAGHDDWHAAATAYVRRHRPVLARYGHADVVERVLAFLEERPAVFDGAGEPVCCHGWATPAHVAVADGSVARVLDFEHAIAAPGEFDYWRTVVPAFGPDGECRKAFRAGYESVRSLPEGFERRKPLYALLNEVYYFESLYVQDQHGPAETEARAARLRENVEERIAHRSDRDRRNA